MRQKRIEGWEGKPEGHLQVLWEQGWIDVMKLHHYTMNGKQVVSKKFS